VPISKALQRWWPLPDSLDLVRAPVDVAATAVLAEVTRFVGAEQLSCSWVPFASIAQVFESVAVFTNVPTVFFVLPTHSDWTVLWNNSFLCDGYDSLCWCLTTKHNLTTMHWRSSDEDAVFQAGSSFTVRKQSPSGLRERSVYCCKNDKRWEFHTVGEPLPEEEIAPYSARLKRDRLNELAMLKLLGRLGARPWEAEFYRVGEAFRIERVSYPNTISQKRFPEFACKRAEISG
jgi:hypothetical protein